MLSFIRTFVVAITYHHIASTSLSQRLATFAQTRDQQYQKSNCWISSARGALSARACLLHQPFSLSLSVQKPIDIHLPRKHPHCLHINQCSTTRTNDLSQEYISCVSEMRQLTFLESHGVVSTVVVMWSCKHIGPPQWSIRFRLMRCRRIVFGARKQMHNWSAFEAVL